MRLLEGKSAIVYGGSGLIGASIAHALFEQGARIAIHYFRGKEKAEALARELDPAGDAAIAVQCDVTSEVSVAAAVGHVAGRFGSLDIVINSVHAPFEPRLVSEMSLSDWRLHQDAMIGHFLICKAALPPMRAKGSGRIVFISAALAVRYAAGCSAYSAVKDGLNVFSRTLAIEEGPHNITVNIVAPGRVTDCESESCDEWDDMTAKFLAMCPLGRFASSRDVANTVLYLVSPLAEGITGQTLYVSGGEIMR